MQSKRILSHQRLKAFARKLVAGVLFKAFCKSNRAKAVLIQAFGNQCTPLAIAKRKTCLLSRDSVEEIMAITETAIKQAAKGELTHDFFSMLKTALDMAHEIEKDGEIRGFAYQLNAAETALQAIYDRCMQGDNSGWRWTAKACKADELEALREFAAAHRFQVENILQATLRKINQRMQLSAGKRNPAAMLDAEKEVRKVREALKDFELEIPRLIAA